MSEDKNRSFQLRICHSIKEVEEIIREYEEVTTTKFVSYHKDKQFGNDDWKPDFKTRVYWKCDDGKMSVPIAYDGIPFMFIGRRVLNCHQGKDTSKAKKQKYAAKKQEKEMEESGGLFVKKRRVVPTKKVECQAVIYITQIMKFLGFKVAENAEPTEVLRKSLSKGIKQALHKGFSKVRTRIVYYIRLPAVSEHSGHSVQDETSIQKEPIDDRVINEIMESSADGTKNPNDIKQHLMEFVQNELFKGKEAPPLARRRYYPKESDIRNYMRKAKVAKCHSKMEEDQIACLIEQWEQRIPDDYFKFYPHYSEAGEPSTQYLLFCYQSKWQRTLLAKYGNDLCVLDDVFRVIQFPLSLYFLLVRTNVEYVVVGMFLIQHENKELMTKAVKIIQDWNPTWKPKNILMDFNHNDMQIVQSVWPEVNVKISDVHRERLWTKWCLKKEHGVRKYKDELLTLLQKIAEAGQAEFEQAVNVLQESIFWQESTALQAWFSNKWFPILEKWADAYQDAMFVINLRSYNGTELLQETLQYPALDSVRNFSLGALIAALISDVFPESYAKYKAVNVQYTAGYPKRAAVVPEYLYNKPWALVDHVLDRMTNDRNIVSIQQLSVDRFLVEEAEEIHDVHFGSDDCLPSCTCRDWLANKLPCAHFCSIFTYITDSSWEQMCDMYRSNPLLNIDFDVCCASLDNQTCFDPEDEITQLINSMLNADSVSFGDRKNPKRQKLRKKCTNKLKELVKFASVLQDEEFMKGLDKSIDEILLQVKVQATTEGIDMLRTSKKRRLSPPMTPNKRQSTDRKPIAVQVKEEVNEYVEEQQPPTPNITTEVAHVEHYIIPETTEDVVEANAGVEEIQLLNEVDTIIQTITSTEEVNCYEILEAFGDDQTEIQQVYVIEANELYVDNSATEEVRTDIPDHDYN